MSRTLYLDLDGCFANFNKKLDSLFDDRTKVSKSKIWKTIGKIPNFFYHLEPCDGYLALFNYLEDYAEQNDLDLSILTALPYPTGLFTTARLDKKMWVHDHLSTKIQVCTVVGGVNKVKFCTTGDILFDDMERNLIPWRDANGIGILHTDIESSILKFESLKLQDENLL